MSSIIAVYRDIFSEMAGLPDKERYSCVPWFAKNIYPPKRYQWAGYIGDCQGPNALAFGFNLEFRPEWQTASRSLTAHRLAEVLAPLADDELHWYGKPGFPYRNPPHLALPPMPGEQTVEQADLELLMWQLNKILDDKILWSARGLMRPQIQVMRRIGDAMAGQDMDIVEKRIREAIVDMRPLVSLMTGRTPPAR